MKNTFLLVCSLILATLVSLSANATPPKTLSYQGVLTNAAAVPVNGTPSMLFSLYDVASGGTALWTETQPSVGVTNGLFNVTLGSVTSIPLAFDVPYFLGVKVGTDAEMSPRQPLAASAYAITALGLDASATVPGSAVVGPITAAQGSNGTNTAIGVRALSSANVAGNENTAIGAYALQNNGFGAFNTAMGTNAQKSNVSGNSNTAIGRQALSVNQTGSGNTGVGQLAIAISSGSYNIALGDSAGILLTTGSYNIAIGNQGVAGESSTIRLGDPAAQTRAFVAGVRDATPASSDVLPVIIDVNGQLGTTAAASLPIREPGANNTFAGTGAGNATLAGDGNVAFGRNALPVVTTGVWNASTGYRSLLLNQDGSYNTANGLEALAANVSGSNNTAIGIRTLLNSTIGDNTAIGANAGSGITTGGNNIAIGAFAGNALTTGGNNIAIGNAGVAAEANTTRIGTSQTRAFMAGISGVNVSGVAVFVDAAGQLGINASSRRFKENVASMSDASADLMRLNPVTFNYLDGQNDGQKLTQYGLIAEEVAEVYPDLVVKTPDGIAETVRYHFLTPMLLNEVQKQQRKLLAQESHAERQAAELQRQAGELTAQREKVAALESELAAIKAMLNHR